jgi:parallel beta-helix repeat protein
VITTEQELIAALAAGGEVLCDSGITIALSQTMDVTVPCRIVGGRFTRSTGPAFEVTTSDVEFDGVHIAGGGTAAGYDISQKLIYVRGTKGAALSGISVHHCTLTQSRGDNVWLEWCTGSAVHDNVITNYLYSGVMVISGIRITVSGNTIADAPLSSGVVNTYGVALTDLSNDAADRSRHCTVVGNTVSLVDWEGIETHGGDGLTITGNTVLGCPRGIALVVGNQTQTVAPTNCLVAGNTVNAAGMRQPQLAGIYLAGPANGPATASATVVGNQIIGYTTPFNTSSWDRGNTYVGNNSEPFVNWTPIAIGADFVAHGTYPPQYRVDGDVVHLRGGVIPKSGGPVTRSQVGSLPKAAAWPTVLTVVGFVKGSNPAAGNGTLAVTTTGDLQLLYGSGTDSYTYFLHGSYVAG